jgi:hypothetical protein
MKSKPRILIAASALALCATGTWHDSAFGQVRTYNVQWTNVAPTIDAVVGPGEWAAAGPAQGHWIELRQPQTDIDTANNRFQMMWNVNGLYILYQVDQTTWPPPPGSGNPDISFAAGSLSIYFDPNSDNEPNFVTNPDDDIDGYELALNQYRGTFISTNADRQGIGFYTEAHVDTPFGDQANWNHGGSAVAGAALQGIVVAQNNGASGGLAEIFIPWTNFNADAPPQPGTTGLYHPFAPSINDTWFFQIGQISNADPNNFLPVYNWTSSQFFAPHPHAEITFVPEPASVALVTLAAIGLAAVVRAGGSLHSTPATRTRQSLRSTPAIPTQQWERRAGAPLEGLAAFSSAIRSWICVAEIRGGEPLVSQTTPVRLASASNSLTCDTQTIHRFRNVGGITQNRLLTRRIAAVWLLQGFRIGSWG